MGIVKKLLVLLMVIAVLYFATTQIDFSLQDNSAKLIAIDNEFGVGTTQLSPLSTEKIEAYELSLRKINPDNQNEKNIRDIKIEIALMQKAMLLLAQNYSSINFNDSDCSAAGPLGLSDGAAGNALLHANAALALQEGIKPLRGQEYLVSAQVTSALRAVALAAERTKKNLDYMCGIGTL